MLDAGSAAVLAAVNEACRGGEFVILEEAELSRALPYGEDVGKILSYLEEKRLIEVRYAEGGTYCVRTMPAGRSYTEYSAREQSERTKSKRGLFLWAFSGSLAGGVLGALFATALEVLLRV